MEAKKIRFFLAAILLLVGNYCICQTTIGHGSLVVVTPSKEGLIIVADKRLTLLTTTKKDNYSLYSGDKTITYASINKIDSLDKFYGFSVCGKRNTANNHFWMTYSFDAVQIIRTYFKKHLIKLDDAKILEQLTEELKTQWLEVDKQEFKLFDAYIPMEEPQSLLCVIFYGFNRVSKVYQLSIIELALLKIEDKSIFNTSYPAKYKTEVVCLTKIIPSDSLKISSHTAIGEIDLDRRLTTGANPKFDSIRQLGVARNFLPHAKKMLEKKEVIAFSKWLIRETSKERKSVSENVDVAIINRKGF